MKEAFESIDMEVIEIACETALCASCSYQLTCDQDNSCEFFA